MILKYLEEGITLDLGCEDGDITSMLRGYKVGTDKDRLFKHGGLIPFVQSDIRHLPFRSKIFTCCVLCQVIEHMKPEEAETVFRECVRVLKNEGQIIVLTPKWWGDIILRSLVKFKLLGEYGMHEHYYSEEELRKICDNAGFRNIVFDHYNLGIDVVCVARKSLDLD
ncbi:MAG: class I SAM-dependent methyltransferase [Methanocellales archaeon]|nr:class I SAM-dependent methyltransferase [Methanocellales archaeon]